MADFASGHSGDDPQGEDARPREGIWREVRTISTSRADDAAYLALRDASDLTHMFADARVVGGQMTSLLLHAFPVDGALPRRTADADAAISTRLAASGDMHNLLLAAGYQATSGNRYVRQVEGDLEQVIDLLVPSRDSRFHADLLGGRAFDAAPGLSLALAALPVTVAAIVTLTDDTDVQMEVRVPPVEHALTMKAFAARDRGKAKDLTDLYNLLSIGFAYREKPSEVGGWRIGTRATGARGDAARILHDIADRALKMQPVFREAGIPRERFVALVRAMVARPS